MTVFDFRAIYKKFTGVPSTDQLGAKIEALDKNIQHLQAKIAEQGQKPDQRLLKKLEGYQNDRTTYETALTRAVFDLMQATPASPSKNTAPRGHQ